MIEPMIGIAGDKSLVRPMKQLVNRWLDYYRQCGHFAWLLITFFQVFSRKAGCFSCKSITKASVAA
jgi:hypothetical protein